MVSLDNENLSHNEEDFYLEVPFVEELPYVEVQMNSDTDHEIGQENEEGQENEGYEEDEVHDEDEEHEENAYYGEEEDIDEDEEEDGSMIEIQSRELRNWFHHMMNRQQFILSSDMEALYEYVIRRQNYRNALRNAATMADVETNNREIDTFVPLNNQTYVLLNTDNEELLEHVVGRHMNAPENGATIETNFDSAA